MKNAFSDNDDANLGRCIFHSTGLPCSTEIKGLELSSYMFKDQKTTISIERLSEDDVFNKALTFWPVPSPTVMSLFHIYFSEVCIWVTILNCNYYKFINFFIFICVNIINSNLKLYVKKEPKSITSLFMKKKKILYKV